MYFFLQLPSEHNGWSSADDLQQSSKVLCPQNAFYEDEIRPDVILGQEDCLFMDIYVRKVSFKKKKDALNFNELFFYNYILKIKLYIKKVGVVRYSTPI